MKPTKTTLTIDAVKHVANLAKLKLSDEEIKKFQKQLSDVISYINQLNSVDTKNIDPTSQVTGLENILREDKVKPSLSQDQVLANAPRKHKGFFVVDAIFEE